MSSTLLTAAAASTATRASGTGRLLPLDALRGLALIFMALDHAAAFTRVSLQAETYGGQPATLLGPAYWVSGLVTNFAAPTFWFLAGVSVALLEASRRRSGIPESEITRFLLIRAGVLITLSLTVCDWAWAGTVAYTQVLLSLGVTLAVLSVARLLPMRVFLISLGVLGLGYQVALSIIAAQFSQTDNFWLALLLGYSTLTRPAVEFSLGGWSVLMGLGFALGRDLGRPLWRRPQTWLAVGGGLLLLWLVLRAWGGFGDLVPFTAGQPWSHFLIMSKEPPSLTFFAFNLGWAALMLAGLTAVGHVLTKRWAEWWVALGQAALFSFVAHILIYNVVSRIVLAVELRVPGVVVALLVWLVGLGVLLPVARAYRDLRRRNPNSLLRYL